MNIKKIKTILDLIKVIVIALASFVGSLSAQSCVGNKINILHPSDSLRIDSVKTSFFNLYR